MCVSVCVCKEGRRELFIYSTPLLIYGFFKKEFFKKKSIYFWPCWVFVAVWPSSTCGERGYALVAAFGLRTVVAFLGVERGLWGTGTSVVVAPGV